MAERVQVAAGTVLHDDAREMRGFELGVECRQERVVEHLEDFSLHLGSVDLLLQRQSLLVDDFHGVKARGRRRRLAILIGRTRTGASEGAEVDGADVAGTDAAEEAEVAESGGGFLERMAE
ncbi:hypothetical protein Pyn_01578 [Prunus yedoensis var. nudiflora]|uniref:Uncharacterized protein n=1 Tax=Prunus yedoensis var. nudiflora TaxID=2094558 RepID=A0A314YNY8_PRUYE|nr:hypothetical protein Pyn_01578 [Prunus yedoensis var. nudiflora]